MRRRALLALSLLACLAMPSALPAKDPPRIGAPVPAIVLPDIAGRKHSLTEWKNKPFVLFFFCGCSPCHDCARLWASAQQAGELGPGRSAKDAKTIAVLLGDADAARRFVSETGLVPAQTLMLTDPSDRTGQRFGVLQCPRVFVIDAGGRLTYTNSENDRLSAPALVSRAPDRLASSADPARAAGFGDENDPMRTVFLRAAFAALLLGSASVSGKGQSLLPVPGLTLADKNTNTYQYDAGVVDTVRTPKLERAFTLKNDGRQPITIVGLRGSCGCETLLLQKNGKPVPTTRLDPGEQAEIHLVIALPSGQPGPARKYVWVDGPTGAGQSVPLATLQIDLTLRQAVSFTPGFLNFGKVEAGAGAALPLTVSLDADLLAASDLPPLQSADPDVQVQAVGPVQRVEEGGKARLRQAYQIVLSPSAHAGRVSGDLRFAESTLSGVSASVTGTVSGALDAMPASVFFGSLPAGIPATRSVILSLASPAPDHPLSASSDAPWLQVALAPSDPAARHRLLTVTLTAQAPVGPVQGKITVALTGGDRLEIPVIAELTK